MRLPRFTRKFVRDKRGNVIMLFGFMIIPLTFSTGMGIDYARAMKTQTKLNAVADAAALIAVSKSLMSQNDTYAQYYSNLMFNTQAQPLLSATNAILDTVTVTSATDANGRRTATVSYRGRSPNMFAKVLGMTSLPIHGTSTTTNATAPNIDFYMLLDVSNSMAFPTTSAGLAQLKAQTGGCQFACHSTNDAKARDKNNNLTDYYGVATSFGLSLRIDDEGKAVSRLTTDAQSTSSKNGAAYKMAIYSFRGASKVAGDDGFVTNQTLTTNLAAAASTVTNLRPALYDRNNCRTSACSGNDVGNNDTDTGTSYAFDQMNTIIPTPGSGLYGNKAQAIMFVVTDGLRDELRWGSGPEMAIDTTKCDALKSRGIRIAVLYTEYRKDSMDGDGWSQGNVVPYLSKIEPALQACATPGLYTKVTTDQDIYTALDNLFQNAVATARISG